MKDLMLSNGIQIPHLGLGTYPLFGDVLTKAVEGAFNAGYRLIDTADNYYNEPDLGRSLHHLYIATDAKREDLFLVTKISDELYHPKELGGGSNRGMYFWKNSPYMHQENAVRLVVREKVENSLRYLGTDYIDALLMHWPYPDYFEEIWYEMEQIYREGKIRAIGVCNCRERHFERLKKSCTILPMINQFETSPLNSKEDTIKYCNDLGVKIMVYSPLMNLRLPVNHPYKMYLKTMSQKYGKSEAQIVLRFDIQRGLIPIPKSTHVERIKNNITIDDFTLEEEEMKYLLSFNENKQYLPESRSCPGL